MWSGDRCVINDFFLGVLDDVLHDLLTNDQTWVLGADHVDRSGRNGRVGGFEKAIKIFVSIWGCFLFCFLWGVLTFFLL